MDYGDDPRLVDVSKQVSKLQRGVDDVVWDHGVDDTRLEALSRELRHYKELQERGVLYEPTF